MEGSVSKSSALLRGAAPKRFCGAEGDSDSNAEDISIAVGIAPSIPESLRGSVPKQC